MQEDNRNYNDDLERYVREDYKIFVDTCSILYDKGEEFWMRLIDSLIRNKRLIFVPARVIDELKGCMYNQNYSKEQRAFIEDRYNIIDELQRRGLVKSYGTEDEKFSNADNVFQIVFTRYRVKYRLLLITQDNNLAKDILRLNDNLSTVDRVYKVEAKRIGANGELRGYDRQIDEDDGVEPFRVCKTVTNIPNTPLLCTETADVGTRLYTPQAEVIELTKKIAAGGEGTIYETNTEYVAKIYKPDKLTRQRYEKLKLMLSRPIKQAGICWPISALYNDHKEFVGFLMPKAKGTTLNKGIFLTPLFKKNFPDWKKRDLVELCVTILKKIIYLHKHNIIMGDLNPNNILFVSPKEVYFVDADSWQIEDFPCPVGTINYTAPEIQGKRYETFLRTLGNENFAVATLLFMLMLPGKPPYAQQGGEDQATNIINMNFSYPLGGETNGLTPDGLWRFMWSHLTYKIKANFYETFRKDGKFSAEDTRLDAQKWFGFFSGYLKMLDNGTMAKQDKMSEEIFPTRFKMNDKIKYVACQACGEPIPEDAHRKVCRKCGDKPVGEEYACAGCGKAMTFTYHEKYNLGLVCGYSYCTDCKSKVVHTATCAKCGKTFELTGGDFDYFKTHGMDLPKKCPECRDEDKKLVTCPICGKEIPLGRTIDGYCKDCLEKDLVPPFKCPGCRKNIIRYTNYHRYVKKLREPYKLCKECSEREAQAKFKVVHKGYCTECGKYFEITAGEADFYRNNNLDLPKRCAACRDKAKSASVPKKPQSSSLFSMIRGFWR